MINRKTSLSFAILMWIGIPIVALGAVSDELNIFTIQNRTGGNLEHLFVTLGDDEIFGADILGGSGPLRSQANISLAAHYPDRCALFNVLAIASNADYFSVFHYEICDGEHPRLEIGRNYFAGTNRAVPDTEIVIENGTAHRFSHLFFVSGESDAWGIDLLFGKGNVAPGGAKRLRLVAPVRKSVFAIRAVDEAGQTFSFSIDVDASERELIFEIGDDWADAPIE